MFDGGSAFDQTTSTSNASRRLELDIGYAWHVFNADFDSDGLPDLAVVDPFMQDETQVFYSDGSGGVETEPHAVIRTDCGEGASASPVDSAQAWLAVACQNGRDEIYLFTSAGP